jgi:hypothetical protein
MPAAVVEMRTIVGVRSSGSREDSRHRYFWLAESGLLTHIAVAVTCRYQGDGQSAHKALATLSQHRDGS